MSFLWISLSLLCSTTFQQTRASGEGVSLTCDNTMKVIAGSNVTINCNVNFQGFEVSCNIVGYNWQNTSSIMLCNSDMTKFTCHSDNLTYVSLSISDVTEQENYTAEVQTDCGMAESSPVEINVQQPNGEVNPRQVPVKTTNVAVILGEVNSRQVPVKTTNVAVILGITLIALVIL